MRRLAPALAALLVLAAGCRMGEKTDRRPGKKERVERYVLFADVAKLAVAPFRDDSGNLGKYEEAFPRLFADELVRLRRFDVIYPRQVQAAAEEANRELVVRARGEKRQPTSEEIIDLERSELDAVHAARAAGADAVLVCAVHDFEIYPPKRLALTVRVYLCAQPRPSFQQIIAMTDDGVPQQISGRLREKFIWERQKNYDSGRKGTRTGMGWHARKHEGDRGFGVEVFYYSTEKFLAFVSSDLSGRLYDDSLRYKALARGKGRAGRTTGGRLPREGRGRSGFEPGYGERGIEGRK